MSKIYECPMTYKGMKDTVESIEPTTEITKVLKPVYNFKATKTRKEKNDEDDAE